ncbi:hypothetical protein ACHHYP_05153 [Achlya hypogyna]|uniref:Uncharacterized protein n=1 Tax=Achlya hypogyna TaxID=1202772 RepID=A0A1V9YZ24_ACHHY|nr:hypothetical protein ACHHYP_05153 [Achlya hypogyna]
MATPAHAALDKLRAEIDLALTASEQEYFDDVVRHKSKQLTKEIAFKRLQARSSLHPTRTRLVCPPAKRTGEKSPPKAPASPPRGKLLRRRLSCSMPSLPITLQSCASPMTFETTESVIPHETSLRIDHLLAREVHASTHRRKMEEYIRKLERENASWRAKFKAEIVKTMDSAALRAAQVDANATTTQLRGLLEAADARNAAQQAEIAALQATVAHLSRMSREMSIEVLDETRLSNNEFELRLVQEQITSAELREVVMQCTEKINELTTKNILLIRKEVEEIKAPEAPAGMSFRAKEAPPALLRFKITTTIDYLDVVPWRRYAGHLQSLVAAPDGGPCPIPAIAVPVVFSAQFWAQQSLPAVHDRWLERVADMGVTDSSLQRLDVDQVLGLVTDIWVDRALNTLQTDTLRVPRQSFPVFVERFFLRRYQSWSEAKAQLYLFLLGVMDFRGRYPRIDVMGYMLGLSNIKCYSPRLADCLLSLLVILVPLQTLAGSLTTHNHQPLLFGQNVVIMALNNVFPLARDPLDVPNYIDRVVISSDTQAGMREMLHEFEPDPTDAPLGTSRSTASSRPTSRPSARAKRWTMLPLEAVLSIAMHVWNLQATKDMEVCTQRLKREAPFDTLNYTDFRAVVAKYFAHEFLESDVVDMFEKASEYESHADNAAHMKRVKLTHCVRMLVAKGVPRPEAIRKNHPRGTSKQG